MIDRIITLRQKMSENQLDAIIVSKPENRYYLTGFTGTSGLLLITHSRAILFTDFRYSEQAKIQTNVEIVEFKEDVVALIKEVLEQTDSNNIGFEDGYITYSKYNNFLGIQKKLLPIGSMLENIRMIKDETEIENIKKAVELGDKAFSYIINFIKPGISEKEIAVELEYYLKKNGAEALSFESIVTCGKRTSLVHSDTSHAKISFGDTVLLDFGCKINSYCSDMTRTVFVGKADEEQKKIYNIVLEAQQRSLDYISSGKKGSDVDKAARDYISQMGYGDRFGHALGHGVGLCIHESPRLSWFYNDQLQPNMIVTLEPGIYIEGFGGVRIEDMVIIREGGVENITKSSKKLIIL